ncbi:hypothetical protein EHP00_282 [Ecytonucleospora hepatopenaei]|uniref:Uncharacterized protein n=1 Tax=Ecytonucleospora hepatopenaei TaxID=646526 RepID=A0A1W0E784_9MICR|nr:hypothetical protein EHP00_282 [Ecytonucleospora hepatopenaei]
MALFIIIERIKSLPINIFMKKKENNANYCKEESKNFEEENINFEDLAAGTGVAFENLQNNAYEVYKEDMDKFLSQKNKTKKPNDFYKIENMSENENLSNTSPASAFAKIIKSSRNEKLLQKKLQMEFEKKMQRIHKIKSKKHKKSLKAANKKVLKAVNDLNSEIYDEVSDESVETEKEDFETNVLYKPIIKEIKNILPISEKEKELNFHKKEENLEKIDLFESEESSTNSFYKIKSEQMKQDAPEVIETVLPGFDGNWAGEGIEIKGNNLNPCSVFSNRIRNYKEGVPIQDRMDFTKSNVIINENIVYDSKYSIKSDSRGKRNLKTDEKVFEKIKMRNYVSKSNRNQTTGIEIEDQVYNEEK